MIRFHPLFILGYLLLCFVPAMALGKSIEQVDNQATRIIVLHSYHQGFVWTDDIMDGIYSVVNKDDPKFDMHIEYMDTKRYFDGLDGKYLDQLLAMYRDKYKEHQFDIILSSDDDAFQFLLRHHQELFPGTPIVFCGVNDFEDAMLAGQERITGILEFLDTKESIDIVLKLHPQSKQLAIITDTSTTGRANRKILEKFADAYRDRLEFIFLDQDNSGTTVDEILDKLRRLPEGTPVYYSDYLRNKDGYVDQRKVVPLIAKTYQGPMYSHYDEILGLGIVGGKLVNGFSHGKRAAMVAQQILSSAPGILPPVVKESINAFMFDHLQLQRFGISEAMLPAGSIIMNKPLSFNEEYRNLVWAVTGVVGALAVLVMVLISNIVRRKSIEGELRRARDEQELNVEARTTELKETNARLETLLQSIPDIVAFKDANGRHILTNKALEEFMGLSHDALSGKTVEDIFPPEIAVLCRQNDERAMRSPGPIRSEESIGKGAGRVILDTIKTPVRDEDGNVKGLVMVGRDITERKHAEEALQQAREQLEQRVQERTLELQKTHAQLLHAEKLSAIGSLSASIAHEFNNPLFGVMNVLSGIKRKGAVSENIEEMVEMAIKECHRMKNLIIDLQDFNRPTSGIVGPMDIHACIDSILLLSKKEFFAKKISIEKKYGENIPEIKAVNDQIKQVFLNLLNNAADACTGIENATITIRTALTDKETLTIRIQDTGKGIKPEHMGRIFDPFFTTKPEIKGTGLGLSISYGIIKKHGGRIDVESEEGKGTTVTVTLPREASQM